MPIEYDQNNGIFHIHNQRISYIIQILKNRYPVHRYFGRFLPHFYQLNKLPSGNHAFAVDTTEDFPFSITSLPLEFSTISDGDYHQPAYLIKDENNQLLPTLQFDSYSISNTPINPQNFPTSVSSHSKVTTLTLHLSDSVTKLKMDLNYTIFENLDIILRSTTLHNMGDSFLDVESLDSLQLNLPDDNYFRLTLNGTHAHEANKNLQKIASGIQMQHTFRGTSGPVHQPFVALARPETDQFQGSAIGTSLIWSGNFEDSIEVDQYQQTRVKIGLEPNTFSWNLEPGQSLQSPEAVLTWSTDGFNGLSQNFHNFARQLQPQQKVPIAINTWENMFFDLSEEKVRNLMHQSHQLGIEMIVIDDGWFINRHGEDGQLGDWNVDQTKFPHGLKTLSDEAHQLKMKFGLWIEPEMITTNSQLYQKHPDWILNYNGRTPVTARHQLVLDLSQKVVRKHLLKVLTKLIRKNNLDYIKWDMNRHLTQVGNNWLPASQQGEFYYRYVLGLYDLLNNLKKEFPNLIIENCSAGGGRVDFGMLSYTNLTWMSDLTDAFDRTRIEDGFSYLFPQNIFSNHISAVPNGQNGRITPLNSRLQIAAIGQMGFELAVNDLSDKAKQKIMKQIKDYQEKYRQFQGANFYRLKSEGHTISWLLVTQDQTKALIFYSYGLTSAVKIPRNLPLHYLDDNRDYIIDSQKYSGYELNTIGLPIEPAKEDFETFLKIIE